MAGQQADGELIPFSVYIRGLVEADRATEFYRAVAPLVETVGKFSTAQTTNLSFNIPAITSGHDADSYSLGSDELSLPLVREMTAEELEISLSGLGSAIRTRRHEVGLSQALVARSAGISQAYLSKIELARKPTSGVYARPKPDALVGIARVLDLDELQMLHQGGFEIGGSESAPLPS